MSVTKNMTKGFTTPHPLDDSTAERLMIVARLALAACAGFFALSVGFESPVAAQETNVGTLRAVAFHQTARGFEVEFNRPLETSELNLYDTETASLGPADVRLEGAGSTASVSGSVVVAPSRDRVTFVATHGTLPPNDYVATLRSAANGFKDEAGEHLDGDTDGAPGGDLIVRFSTTTPPPVVLEIPDFARGPGQPIDIPADGKGLPLTLTEAGGVDTVEFLLVYDPALLTTHDVLPGSSLPPASTVEFTNKAPGNVRIRVEIPNPLPPGPAELVLLDATVPEAAPYGEVQVLSGEALRVNNGKISAGTSDGLHVAAYLADTTRNGRYSSLDAQRILRVVIDLDSGFAAYPNLDPTSVADVTRNGYLSPMDAVRLMEELAGTDQPEIPPIPQTVGTTGGDAPTATPLRPSRFSGERLRGTRSSTLKDHREQVHRRRRPDGPDGRLPRFVRHIPLSTTLPLETTGHAGCPETDSLAEAGLLRAPRRSR